MIYRIDDLHIPRSQVLVLVQGVKKSCECSNVGNKYLPANTSHPGSTLFRLILSVAILEACQTCHTSGGSVAPPPSTPSSPLSKGGGLYQAGISLGKDCDVIKGGKGKSSQIQCLESFVSINYWSNFEIKVSLEICNS